VARDLMPPIITVIAITTFAASLSSRAIDPVLPHISDDFTVTAAVAASLSAATAFSFAMIQPLLGAIADLLGKAKLILFCLIILGVANFVGAFTHSFEMLFVTRILCGIGSGGVFPVAMALTSDLTGIATRQIAMSRLLGGAMTGNLLGASLSGIVGDYLGWRGVLVLLGVLVLAACIAVAIGFRGAPPEPRKERDLSSLKKGYLAIMANPNARVCYTAVFVEGICVLGLFPFVAAFLFELGETQSSTAGWVISGFAVGGLIYTLMVSRLLPWIGVRGLMIGGAALMASQLAIVGYGPRWEIQALCFVLMGVGFYNLHGSLQVFASDLAPAARASALSLHAFFFFMGQAVGPILYGISLDHLGKHATLLASAAIILAVGFVCARFLSQKPAPVAEG
jgi:predicted MFS family arabinose efflux permease